MKHTHILFVILAIILCVGCDYIQSPEEAAGENKNDLQYVNMDGLRRELADIRSTSFENLDIKNCAFFDVPDKMRSEERRVGKECRSRWSPYH